MTLCKIRDFKHCLDVTWWHFSWQYARRVLSSFCSAKGEFDIAKKDEKRALSGSIWYILVFTETWNQAGSVPLDKVAFLLAILYGEETQNLRTSSWPAWKVYHCKLCNDTVFIWVLTCATKQYIIGNRQYTTMGIGHPIVDKREWCWPTTPSSFVRKENIFYYYYAGDLWLFAATATADVKLQ